MHSSTTAPAPPSVACVLVNWNNWQDTAECLASLALQNYPDLRVIVVDNGSTNDSLAQLRAAHPWPTYIDTGYNAGFAKGCNIGARHPLAASADFVWLLNNDTSAPPETASRLVAQALAKPRAGVIGAILFYGHDPSRIQAWGGGQVNLWTGYNWHYTAPVVLGRESYITFASAFIRRQTFDQLKGLFEGVFMYFEDSDFCLRAQAAGWQLSVALDTAILHKQGGSIKATRSRRIPHLERTVTLSGLIFLGRHATVPFISQTVFVALRLAQRLLDRDWPAVRAVLLGVRDWRRRTPTDN